MNNFLIRGLIAAAALSGCGAPETTCGPGTQLQNGQCVVAMVDTSPLTALLTGANVAFSRDPRIGNYVGGTYYARRLVLYTCRTSRRTRGRRTARR
jgi:hypothetical protein